MFRTALTMPRHQMARVLVVLTLVSIVGFLFCQNVSRYYFVGDDCFIAFRYARNLADGHGLTWNPGERVEGYTQPLWVLLMAVGLRLGIEPERFSTAIGITSGVLVLMTLLIYAARRRSLWDPFAWLPVLVLANSKTFTAWCTGGLETMLFTLLLLWAFLAFLSERARKSAVPLLSSGLFTLATLCRPDGGIFMFVAGIFFLGDILAGRRSMRSGVLWAFPFVAAIGAHFIWRYNYYGFWLPNTFYAKVGGFWWDQGFMYFSAFAKSYHILWFLPFIVVPTLARRDYVSGLFASATALYLIYVLSIGGDRFEFRFLVVVFPYFYWLLTEGMSLLSALGRPTAVLRTASSVAAYALAAALVLTTANGSLGSLAVLDRFWMEDIEDTRAYADIRVREGKFIRRQIDKGVLPENLVLGVKGAGAVPYYTRWTTVDQHGLNDVEIAHTPLERRGVIAHEHDATYEYLLRRKVAVLDILNKLIFPASDDPLRKKRHLFFQGHRMPIRAIKLEDQYLVFSSFLSDLELQDTLKGHEILR